jgi:hypothetical protein
VNKRAFQTPFYVAPRRARRARRRRAGQELAGASTESALFDTSRDSDRARARALTACLHLATAEKGYGMVWYGAPGPQSLRPGGGSWIGRQLSISVSWGAAAQARENWRKLAARLPLAPVPMETKPISEQARTERTQSEPRRRGKSTNCALQPLPPSATLLPLPARPLPLPATPCPTPAPTELAGAGGVCSGEPLRLQPRRVTVCTTCGAGHLGRRPPTCRRRRQMCLSCSRLVHRWRRPCRTASLRGCGLA